MLTEEMMRAAVQEREQAVADFTREEESRALLRATDGAVASAPRGRTFVPTISIAGIRQFVGTLGRA